MAVRSINTVRSINVEEIRKIIEEMVKEGAYNSAPGMACAFEKAAKTEENPLAKIVLSKMEENFNIAKEGDLPICQDTGMAVVILEIGQDVHFTGGLLEDAINQGVANGYTDNFLRKSMLDDPLFARINTKDNTPALITYKIVPGDKVKIYFMPKGGGSENVGATALLKPAEGVEGVKAFVRKTMENAGGSPCPPVVVGVGIGGNLDKAVGLAKEALLRPVGEKNKDERYAKLEEELLEICNSTNIGIAGFGGKNTAFAVHVEYFPTHLACLPVAIIMNCSAARLVIREM